MYLLSNYRRGLPCLAILLALLVCPGFACKKESAVTSPAKKPEKKEELVPALEVESSLGAFPSDAVVVAGISSLNELKGFLTTASTAMDTPVDFEGGVLPGLLNEVGVQGSAGVDLDRPLYVVVWNPKKFSNTTLLIPLKNREELEKSLGERKKASTVGVDFLLKGDFRDLHGLYMGNYIALSQDLIPLTEHRAFLERIHKSFMPGDTLHVLASARNFARIYAVEWEQDRNAIVEKLTQDLRDSGVLGSANDLGSIPPAMVAAYTDQIDKAVNFLKSVHILDIRARVNKDRLVVEVVAEADKESELHKFLLDGAKRDTSILLSVPATTSLLFSSFLEKNTLHSLTEENINLMASVLELTPEEKTRFQSAIRTAYDGVSGGYIFALYSQEKFPLSLMTVNLVQDGTKFKKALQDLAEIARKKAQTFMLKQGGGGPQLDFSSWPTVITQLDQTARPFGVGMELVEQGQVLALRINGNYDASPFIPPKMKPLLKKHVGPKLEFALGVEEKTDAAVVMTFGPNAIQDAVDLLARKNTFANASYETSKKRGARNAIITFWWDMGLTLRALAPLVRDLGPLAGKNAEITQAVAQGFETFPTGTPMRFSGGSESNMAHLVLDLSFAPFQALRKMAR